MFDDTVECWVELFGSGSPSQIYLPKKSFKIFVRLLIVKENV